MIAVVGLAVQYKFRRLMLLPSNEQKVNIVQQHMQVLAIRSGRMSQTLDILYIFIENLWHTECLLLSASYKEIHRHPEFLRFNRPKGRAGVMGVMWSNDLRHPFNSCLTLYQTLKPLEFSVRAVSFSDEAVTLFACVLLFSNRTQ